MWKLIAHFEVKRNIILKNIIYNCLVNEHPGIAYRYHRFHDNSHGIMKVISWVYLLWLNFAYYVLQMKFLGKKPNAEIFEAKRLNCNESESEAFCKKNPKLTVEKCVEELMRYDVVSFDIFDTLIFRTVDTPIDAFYLIGERLGLQNFRGIRVWAEYDARMKCKELSGHTEITLRDIWENLIEDVGSVCSVEDGMQLEIDTEFNVCYANPFMLKVWQELLKAGKETVIVSDMYLSSGVLREILKRAGYEQIPNIFVSCEHGVSKADGKLYEIVKKSYQGKSLIHVGDNIYSDNKMARKAGLSVYLYPNINKNTMLYRPFDMSYLIGSAYRALISSHIYNGLGNYSMEYEYGFIYGGLFVLGYCHFIHEYCRDNSVDKVIFLSRDGDVLKKVYDYLYPYDDTEYALWSRKVATKLMADLDKHDFFRRFIYHKVNQHYSVRQILKAMELEEFCDYMDEWPKIWSDWCIKHPAGEERKFESLSAESELTDKNAYLVRILVEAYWEEVLLKYSKQNLAAGLYYSRILNGCKKVAAVDIGWAGSGALSLDMLANNVWGNSCAIIGIIAGTNTVNNAEPDATEYFRQSGKLVPYLYSASCNRDLWKKHDPNKDYNVFWELILGSPTPGFNGFRLLGSGEVDFDFGDYDSNLEGICDVQSGIMDFAFMYHERWKDYPYMEDISGRDAYAPILLGAGYGEKYLKSVEKKFELEVNVV